MFKFFSFRGFNLTYSAVCYKQESLFGLSYYIGIHTAVAPCYGLNHTA
ncbi:MAG: hypothetical protein J6A85_01790 [Clostridia bacterium]|nr:hypothetical protein [Clostridia bacterium]